MCIPEMSATIDVILHKARTLSNGENPLVLRITKNRQRKYIRFGISLNPEFWDCQRNKLKPKCPDREYIESVITEKKSKYQKQVLEFQAIGKDYSLQQLCC